MGGAVKYMLQYMSNLEKNLGNSVLSYHLGLRE